MFVSAILEVVTSVITLTLLILSALMFFNAVDALIIPLLVVLVMILMFFSSTAAVAMKLIAFYQISRENNIYIKIAFWICLSSYLFFIVQTIASFSSYVILYKISLVVPFVCNIAIYGLFTFGINTVLKKIKRDDVVFFGNIVFAAKAITTVFSIIRIFIDSDSFNLITTAMYIPEFALSFVFLGYVAKIKNVLTEYQKKTMNTEAQTEEIQQPVQ